MTTNTPSQAIDTFDNEKSLMRHVRALVKADSRSLPELYRDTGISFFWLQKFQAGKFANPSVNRVQFLYEYLSGKTLEF
jgi:hypothetical protein